MALEISELEALIESLQACEEHQSNAMLQHALTVARLALSPASDDDDIRDYACQTMLEMIRAKRQRHPLVSPKRFDHRRPEVLEKFGKSPT